MSATVLLGAFVGSICMGLGLVLGRARASRKARAFEAALRLEGGASKVAFTVKREEMQRDAELSARESMLALRVAMEPDLAARELELRAVDEKLATREEKLRAEAERVAAASVHLSTRRERVAAHQGEIVAIGNDLAALDAAKRKALEAAAGEAVENVRSSLVDAEVEDARSTAAQLLRAVDQSGSDPEQARRAERIMAIAVGRCSGHYLTERLLSVIPFGLLGAGEEIIGPNESNLRMIEGVANVRLVLLDTRDAIRLDGLDGVGREIARRCLQWLARNPRSVDPIRSFREIADRMDQEILDLGQRAFAVLRIERAHVDIVKLVGRLNYRTSFTQNQWKHAVEAAFLCGMIADELGLDWKLARRAALLHDIGKALTHEMDGSHAAIGADYARRLGENEIVANAIGAHHTDEPFNSPYALLVAAADAMSGARPGARRQMEENFISKIADLERITRGFRGVGEAFAVQGGREVRVYVDEARVDDLRAVEMSAEIARKISAELRFPGQIKVTVIRELRAEEIAN